MLKDLKTGSRVKTFRPQARELATVAPLGPQFHSPLVPGQGVAESIKSEPEVLGRHVHRRNFEVGETMVEKPPGDGADAGTELKETYARHQPLGNEPEACEAVADDLAKCEPRPDVLVELGRGCRRPAWATIPEVL